MISVHSISRLADTGVTSVQGLWLPYLPKRIWTSFDRIVRLEGQGNYTIVHLSDGSNLLVALTLKRLIARLPAPAFVRLHRKHIINRQYVVAFQPNHQQVCLEAGQSIRISRRFLPIVREQFQSSRNHSIRTD
jgi:two-component system, LytTR family, response regulator